MTKPAVSEYPRQTRDRDRWVLERRQPRNRVDPLRPYDFLIENERAASGEIVPVATIFLTNRECPWRCVMCDLWKNTLTDATPVGAVPGQIDYALARLPPSRQIKLYNSGSFFDMQAIPPEDYPTIARCTSGFERVIVESHPALIGRACFEFADRLDGQLEVAMGLETAHPQVLEKLNKRITLPQFARASAKLRVHGIDLRVFILVQPPFLRQQEALEWAARSLDFAFDCGATVATLIPTRAGNGSMEELASVGLFAPPSLATLEAAVAHGVSLRRGRVFADLWDAKSLSACAACRDERISRLERMNLLQSVPPPIACDRCGGSA